MSNKAIIFDCFGVLYVDAGKAYLAAFPDMSEQFHELNTACDHGFISRSDYLATISKMTGDASETIEAAFLKEHTINAPMIDYIRRELKPKYKIAMLSNIGRDWMQNFFDEHALHDLFDVVVLSSDEGITKPDVEIYRRTADRLGIRPENCVMVDDREANSLGAKAAAMQAITYVSFEQAKRALESTLLDANTTR